MSRFVLGLVVLVSLVACGGKVSNDQKQPQAAAPVPVATAAPAPALKDFSCEISLADVPREMRVGGEPGIIKVKVVNGSAAAWPAWLEGRNELGSVNVAYHWRLGEENVVDGGRARLAADLAPNQGVDVLLTVVPPPKEGDYVLRVQPVQEAVAWFAGQGGCKADAPVKVVR